MVSSVPARAAEIAHFAGQARCSAPCRFGPVIACSAFMRSFAKELVDQVEEGIRVLRIRDGMAVTEAQVHERAANIVTGLMGLYDVRPLPTPEPRRRLFASARWAQLRHLFHRRRPQDNSRIVSA
jgi:hypothetical protein